MIDAGLIISYVLIALSVVAAILLPLIQAAGNIKSLKKVGISVGVLFGTFIICYAIASDSTVGTAVSAGTAKMVSAGLIMFYVLLVVAIVSIVYTEISKASK